MHHSRKPRIAVFDFSESPQQSGMGRVLASQLTEHLLTSPHYIVLKHGAWKNAPGGGAVNQGCRFSRAWAVNAGTLVSADAVVLGNIHHSRDNGNLTLQAAMVDAVMGEIVAELESTSLNELVAAFNSRRVVMRISMRRSEIRGVVLRVNDGFAIFNVGSESGIRKGDCLRLERVLERVPDPFCRHRGEALGYLTAPIAQASVEDVGRFTCLLRVSGTPRVGDIGVVI